MSAARGRWWAFAGLVAGALGAACVTDRPTTGTRVIRVAQAGAIQFDDLAAVLAHERLEAAGYVIELQRFPTSEIAVDTLARGDVDLAFGSTRPFWIAIARGAPLTAVMEHVTDVHQLVVAGAPGCDAIGDSLFALQSEAAAGSALARAYLARVCPGLEPRVIFVPGSTNRMSAMLSGAISATVLQLASTRRLERLAPGRFTVMAEFVREWPDVATSLVHVNTRFAEARPDSLRAYVAARVAAHRDLMANDSRIVDLARRILGDEPDWVDLAPIYRKLGAWDPDGGLTRARVTHTLDFLTTLTGLPSGLTVDQVSDLSVLESVLPDEGLAREPDVQ